VAEQRSGSAADQVRAVLEAAEQVRAQAEADAERTRGAVGKVGERAELLRSRLDELAAAVSEAVAELRAELEALKEEAEAPEAEPPDDALIAEAEAVAARPPEVEEPLREDVPAPDEPEPQGLAEEPAPAAKEEPAPLAEGPAPAAKAGSAAPEGARLLALKMALDGRSRDETAAYLKDNFELDDPQKLLDEVYAQAGR
jgi:hypothetical protein